MKNAELIQFCKDEGIDVPAKNISKPTKNELLAAIKEFYSKTDIEEKNEGLDAVEEELEAEMTDADEFLAEPETNAAEKKVPATKESKAKTRARKRRQQYDELMPLKRVLITSNADNQTKTNLVFITWGNGLIGHKTDRVYLGRPWHVREGALRNMRNSVIRRSIQNEDENRVDWETVPAYNIQELAPLTKQEIETIGRRQTIRDASIESLV